MSSEIQLISDGDGLAVIGEPTAVERFLVSEGLPSRDLGLARLGPAVGLATAVAQAGATVAAGSGRWLQLTADSAAKIQKAGLMPTGTPGVSYAMVGQPGAIDSWVKVATGASSMLTNPAMLAGVAGIMAQLAMRQTMDEIVDYLATIDAKIDDVLRAQKDAALADMIGVDFVVEEALTVREHVGRVSEVTWSKVQATSLTIARTQAYALRQLDALAVKVEHQAKIGDLAKSAQEAQAKVREWLAVLARCLHLQEAIALLELDRVLDTAPAELDQHRLGLKAAREKRLELIARSTGQLMARMDAAARLANTKVLLHPTSSPAVVHARNHVVTSVVDFHGRLGIGRDPQSVAARRWVEAATEAKDKALETGAEGVQVARRLGTETLGRARSVSDQLSSRITDRALRRRGTAEER